MAAASSKNSSPRSAGKSSTPTADYGSQHGKKNYTPTPRLRSGRAGHDARGDLIQNRSAVAVTKENRLQLQSEAFFEGLSEMIELRWIRMFDQQEMQILLGFMNTPIDFDDLRGKTNYGGLYDDNEETIVMFWTVVNTFDHVQRMALLQSTAFVLWAILVQGFKELVPV
ncbi:hypothetical protein DXG01_015209 [Tephrocybe rancida]|nr:hypothetical protein DXG01_015209 [Tephrocybe rancida]